ncbi:MAG: DUF4838 domain-containing protein [Planctomycetota bacterium]|jgi:hypothetical protein
MPTIDITSFLRKKEICILTSADKTDSFAAVELAENLSAISGFKIPVIKKTADRYKFIILVGNKAFEKYTGVKAAQLSRDEVEIKKVSASCIAIRGGGPGGTLYAVYEVLDFLGCRWFNPEEAFIPRLKKVKLPTAISKKPGFAYREQLWKVSTENDLWACRNRLNGSNHNVRKKYGGSLKWDPFVHSFYKIIPPEKYSRKNPEYFSYRHGQGRVASGAQLCLSNQDVYKLLLDHTLQKMADPDIHIVDISQNDCANPCQCPECEARDKKGKSHSASIINICNRIAEETSKKYPDKYVGTLAYTYSVAPPAEMKIHNNVIVRLCHMENVCDSHPLEECKHNQEYIKTLKSWRKKTDHVYIWHYVTNFLHCLLFHPAFDALSQDIAFYKKLGVEGLYLQGFNVQGVSFAEMHAYAMARCLWDPSRNYMKEVKEFAECYYGPAGRYILKMIHILQQNSRKGLHSEIYTHPHTGLFEKKQLQQVEKHLDKAFDAVKRKKKFTKRLELVRLWLNYSKITATTPLKKKKHSLHATAAPEAEKLFADLKAGMKKNKIKTIREFPCNQQDIDEALGWSIKTHDMPLEIIENDFLRAEICPEHAGMLCALFDKKSGTDLLCKPAPWILGYPYIAGMTGGIVAERKRYGFTESYKLIESDSSSKQITISAALKSGIRIRKVFYLADNSSSLEVKTTCINKGKRAVSAAPHSFMITYCGKLKDVRFFSRNKAGKFKNLENTSPEYTNTSQSQWVNLSGSEIPARSWGYFNQKQSIGLQESFERKPVFCSSTAYQFDQRILMETRFRSCLLKPGNKTSSHLKYSTIHSVPAGIF